MEVRLVIFKEKKMFEITIKSTRHGAHICLPQAGRTLRIYLFE